MRYVVAVDIGATYLRVALVNERGEILYLIKNLTPREPNPYAIPNKISGMIREVLKECKVDLSSVLGIGIGSIGPLDVKSGVIVNPCNIPGVKNVPVRRVLEETFNKKVVMVNDCVAAVWGEKHYGSGRDYDNLVYITFSTGIGAGVIVDGNLLLGKDGNAHEVGHIVVDYKYGLKCGCGGIGHWEAYASGANIPKLVKYLLGEWGIKKHETKLFELIEKQSLEAKYVFNLAMIGDKVALRVIDELGKINAAGIASVINVYDPELISLGGAIMLNNPMDLTLKPILKYLDNYVLNRKPKIIVTSLGHEITLLGAAALIYNPPQSITKYVKVS